MKLIRVYFENPNTKYVKDYPKLMINNQGAIGWFFDSNTYVTVKPYDRVDNKWYKDGYGKLKTNVRPDLSWKDYEGELTITISN